MQVSSTDSSLDGQYLQLGSNANLPTGEDGANFEPDILLASSFTNSGSTGMSSSLDGGSGVQEFANIPFTAQKKRGLVATRTSDDLTPLEFDTQTQIDARNPMYTGTFLLDCSIEDDGELSCTTSSVSHTRPTFVVVFANCESSPGLQIGPDEPSSSDCQSITLTAIPLVGAAIGDQCLPAPIISASASVTVPLTAVPSVTIAPSVTLPSAASTTVALPIPTPTFALQVVGSGQGGQYLVLSSLPYCYDVLEFAGDMSGGSEFTLDFDGHLTTGGEVASLYTGAGDGIQYFVAPDSDPDLTESTCAIVGDLLSCVSGEDSAFYVCPDRDAAFPFPPVLRTGSAVSDDASCEVVALQVVEVAVTP